MTLYSDSPDVMMPYCDVTCHHIICHSDGTRHLTIVLDYHVMRICLVTLTFHEPTTLTYNPRLAKIKVNSHTKTQGHRLNGFPLRVLTDGQTETRL